MLYALFHKLKKDIQQNLYLNEMNDDESWWMKWMMMNGMNFDEWNEWWGILMNKMNEIYLDEWNVSWWMKWIMTNLDKWNEWW